MSKLYEVFKVFVTPVAEGYEMHILLLRCLLFDSATVSFKSPQIPTYEKKHKKILNLLLLQISASSACQFV